MSETEDEKFMAGEQWSDDQIAEVIKREDVKSILPSPAEHAKWVANARRIIEEMAKEAALSPQTHVLSPEEYRNAANYANARMDADGQSQTKSYALASALAVSRIPDAYGR